MSSRKPASQDENLQKAEESLLAANQRLRVLQKITSALFASLNPQKVFKQITNEAVNSLGYTSAFIAVPVEDRRSFKIRSFSTEKGLVEHINKILGFDISSISIPMNPELNDVTRLVGKGELVVTRSLADMAYPFLSKKVCTALQKLGGIKNYIIMPLWIEDSIVGVMIMTSTREDINKEDLNTIKSFAQAASIAINNANLYDQLQNTREELEQSEQKYRLLVENQTDFMIRVDKDHKFEFVSPSFCRFIGRTESELIGENYVTLVHERDIKDQMQAIHSLNDPPHEIYIRHRNLTRDGWKWVGWSYKAILDKESNYVGVTGVGRDITERKIIEEELKESEEKYRSMVERAHDGICIIQDYKIVYASPRMVEMWGGTYDEFIGTSFIDYIHAENRDILIDNYRRRIAGESVESSYEASLVNKNGDKFYCELNAGPIIYQGKPAHFVFVGDIHGRKLYEEELKWRSQMEKIISDISTAFVNMPSDEIDDGINKALKVIGEFTGIDRSHVFLFSPDGTRLSNTHEWCAEGIESRLDWLKDIEAKFKISRMTFAGETFCSQRVADFPPDMELEKEVYLKQQIKSLVYVPMVTRDKVFGRIGLDSIREEKAWPDYVISMLRIVGEVFANALERRRVEQELKYSRENYYTLFNSVNDAIFVQKGSREGPPLKYMEVNDAACRMLGYTREELLQLTYRDVDKYYKLNPGDSPDFVAELYEKGEAISERILVAKDGRGIPVEMNSHLFMMGTVPTIITLARDISRRKNAEAERLEMEQKALLSNHLASVGEMASGIAHEINNPLTGVVGYSQLLLQNEDIPQHARDDLEAINEGARRVADIVKRLLTFARQQKTKRTYIDINKIVQNTLALRAYIMSTNNVEVATEFADNLPMTVADGGQLQQVFLNMIVNAETEMKLAKGGGKLIIRTELAGDNIRITFKDNGPGIPKENLDKIFNPFFTTRDVGQGTGLGLSICHGIVTDHGGSISVKSIKGRGATFIVELPLVYQPEQLELTEADVSTDRRVDKAKILVADDETVVNDFLYKLLTVEGHQVDISNNGEEAYNKIKDNRYNLIMLDIKMPGMSGDELYSKIQEISQSLADRVVFITGDIMGKETMTFLKNTKAPYITKPFDADKIRTEVKRLLARK